MSALLAMEEITPLLSQTLSKCSFFPPMIVVIPEGTGAHGRRRKCTCTCSSQPAERQSADEQSGRAGCPSLSLLTRTVEFRPEYLDERSQVRLRPPKIQKRIFSFFILPSEKNLRGCAGKADHGKAEKNSPTEQNQLRLPTSG